MESEVLKASWNCWLQFKTLGLQTQF
jgi:hypothetical protein